MEGKQSDTLSWVRGKCIGRGSFGTVHLATNAINGALFAVKSAANNTAQADALDNEIRILSSLSSPYIVRYLGDDVSGSSRNLLLEYLPGGSMADRAGCLEELDVRSFTRCVVSALRYVHSRGIVHCDVKGSNVLIGAGTGSAKLADFGSATEVGCGFRVSPRGSPLWMAPEVVRGEYQGPESDVWSLGCTVVEMVTGKPAWEDRGLDTLNRIGYSDELPQLPARLSEMGRDFLEKCLRREPGRRWSCDQLLQHPFLSSLSPDLIIESSPRCVLDWFISDSEEEEEEEEEEGKGEDKIETCSDFAKQRIGELAEGAGANWESNGWEFVRGSSVPKSSYQRTGHEYSGSGRIRHGTPVGDTTSFQVSNFRGGNSLGRHVDGSTGELFGCGEVSSEDGTGPSCRHASQRAVDVAVEMVSGLLVGFGHDDIKFCTLLLLLVYWMFFPNINNSQMLLFQWHFPFITFHCVLLLLCCLNFMHVLRFSRKMSPEHEIGILDGIPNPN